MTIWLKNNKILLFLVIFCTVFFSIYAYFNLLVMAPKNDFLGGRDAIKFSSPDETANYFWIKRLAQGQSLYYFEELNGIGTNLIHLRAMNTVEGKVTPGSFIGMIIIYGSLAKIFTPAIIPFLTPFFSILGLIFFYLLINKLFNHKSVALISAVLLSFFPAWLYYSARGLYHNILFISLLIVGIYVLFLSLEDIKDIRDIKDIKYPQYLKYLQYPFSGFLIGLSIITRASEIVWLAFSILFIFIFKFKKIHWLGFILFLCGLWLPILILLYYNQILYGAFISAGYKAIVPEGGIGAAIKSGILFQMLISPFGFDPKSILINAYNYLIQFLPYWSIPTILGGLLFITLPEKILKINYKKRISYTIFCLLLIAYCLLFYGSWQFADRIDEQTLSLGTSYLRYWLPIYILALPFLAILIYNLSRVPLLIGTRDPDKSRTYESVTKILLSSVIIILLAMPSFNLVYRQTDESLFLLKNLSESRIKSRLINQKIKPDEVAVIYRQAVKIFFPERARIITDLVVPADYQAVARLAELKNIYYYTFAPPATVEFISRRDFEQYGLKIVAGEKLLGSDWLYKIIRE